MKVHYHRFRCMIRKEVLHILHDPRTLFIVFLLPVVQLIMFGYALNFEIKSVGMAVVDLDRSQESRHLIEAFEGSPFFSLFLFNKNMSQIESVFESRKAKVVLVIPGGFNQQLHRQPVIPVQLIVDASDANAATLIQNYCEMVIQQFNQRTGNTLSLPFEIRSSVYFNPDLKSTYFFVPGLIAMILIMISALLTSITIVREKETGTFEQILVSPVRPHEIILGKVLPYILLAFMDGMLILAIGVFIFHIPFIGSLVLLLLLSILYIITALSMGLLISTVAPTQQVAMMMAIMATLLPTIMLSGLVFPVASMPKVLQYISLLIPARFYLLIVRGIMLKGSTITQLLSPALVLTVMTLGLLFISVKRFSLNLE
jgi:ABC-2 type transport system permease protein